MSKKHTIKYIKQYFEEHGCELLEEEYKNSHIKMRYICNCEKEHKMSFSNFKTGKRCKKCGNKKIGNKKRYSYKYVYDYFESNSCRLLEIEYLNSKTKMKYKCNCGNVSKINFNNFKNGNRCRKCSGSEKYTLNYVQNCFKYHGCKLIEKTYENNHTPMEYKCDCGRIDKISFNKFILGQRCHYCAHEKTKGENNGNHNPNLTDEERLIKRNYPEYNQWRTAVYERDDYTCQKCFKKGIRFNAHHIEGFAENKDLRTDMDNGITLCEQCHKKFHIKYGKTKIQKKHLNMFLKISNT